mmetsp:Transcript_37250/g.54639  ORF Transcript_37250/g.54639 Transcript_37250/m.54639 type:complete len:220 (-) Transcript_37250:809-1468(-)
MFRMYCAILHCPYTILVQIITFMCLYIFRWVCKKYILAHVHVHISMCEYINTCTLYLYYKCTSVSDLLCANTSQFVYACMHKSAFYLYIPRVCVCACICVCMHMHLCVYTNKHASACVSTYTIHALTALLLRSRHRAHQWFTLLMTLAVTRTITNPVPARVIRNPVRPCFAAPTLEPDCLRLLSYVSAALLNSTHAFDRPAKISPCSTLTRSMSNQKVS